MAKVYSWEVSKSPKKYAYIVHPNDYNKAYVGTELKGENLEKVKEWASNCTDSEYKAQFQKMTELCASKGYNVTFETVAAYLDVDASCDNLRGPSGRGIKYIKQYGNPDPITGETTYGIFYDDDINDENPDFFTIKNGRDGKDGIDGKPGAPGDSGVSSKFIMVYTSGKDEYGNLFTPSRPEGGSYNFDTNETKYPVGWAPNDTEITPPVWMSSRTFTTTEASTDKQWSLPIQITGENGAPGVDGTSTEFIFCLVPEKPSVEGLPSPNESGYVPPASTGWTPSPTGVDEDNTTEWASIRRFNTNTKIWGPWEEAYIWSKYGVNGQDGDGVQYIFLKNRGELPENPTPSDFATNDLYQNKDNEWVPESNKSYINIYGDVVKFEPIEKVEEGSGIIPAGVWTDNPSDVTSQFHSQWVSMRKYRKNSDGKMSWDKYSDPALWGRFGQDGRNATSIRKLFALSTSTSNPPTLPGDSVITGDWGTGFPIDYEAGKNVVWATEAEIWAHNFEFVMSYKLASSRDENGNVIPPADATEVNTFDTTYLPEEEIIGFKYIRYDKDYYEWSGGWCKPYIVTGLKGDDAAPIDYTTSVFGYGYKDYPPSQPNGTHIDTPGVSTDALGNVIEWSDFPNTSGNKVDGVVDDQNRERRWYQCIGHVEGSGKIKKWGDVAPLNPQDGEGGNGTYVEFRFAVTSTTDKPSLNIYDEVGAIAREPVYKENDVRMGWFATDEELPDIPPGGAMWQIWATIDAVTNEVQSMNGKTWCGPKRVSGEKGEQGIQGPAGMRGVTGIPGAKFIQRYCLGTYDKFFGESIKVKNYFNEDIDDNKSPFADDLDNWYVSTEMPYSDIIDVTSQEELNFSVLQYENRGRVIRFIEVSNDKVGGSNSQTITHTYYLVTKDNVSKQLTNALPDSEEFHVYVWCIQGSEIWQPGVVNKYVDITTYDENGATIKPADSDETNTYETETIPDEKNELYKYLHLTSNGKDRYYEWRGIDGDKVEHKLTGIEWGSPFKLQGTNGLRGLTGSRGQVVYPMGVYNHEEVYITTADKAPYVYDPEDGMYYVYNITEKPWVGRLPGYNKETDEYDETIYKNIRNDDGTFKYSIDGTGNTNTWMTDQQGDTPSNNYANLTNSNKKPAWVRFESFQALYTSIGIIENGMIGSAVYNNEFMFSQQGIDAKKKPTNYAVVSGKDTRYGFLSAYVYDEKGEYVNGKPTGRHWKYSNDVSPIFSQIHPNAGKYISDFDVNPYETITIGETIYPIHTFRPNVCINFATGQMWTATGDISFGANGERNVLTDKEVNDQTRAINTKLNNWAADNLISPVERQSLINAYDSIKAEYNQILTQANDCGLDEYKRGDKEYKDYIDDYKDAYKNACDAFDYYTDSQNANEDGCIIIDTTDNNGHNYNNIKTYYEKRQTLLQKCNEINVTNFSNYKLDTDKFIATVGEYVGYDSDKNKCEAGFVAESKFAEVFARKLDEEGDNELKASIKTYINDNVSVAEVSADIVKLTGSEIKLNDVLKVSNNNVTMTNVIVDGSIRSPFVLDELGGNINRNKHDNFAFFEVSEFNTGEAEPVTPYPDNIAWTPDQTGRKITIANSKWYNKDIGVDHQTYGYVKLQAPGTSYIVVPDMGDFGNLLSTGATHFWIPEIELLTDYRKQHPIYDCYYGFLSCDSTGTKKTHASLTIKVRNVKNFAFYLSREDGTTGSTTAELIVSKLDKTIDENTSKDSSNIQAYYTNGDTYNLITFSDKALSDGKWHTITIIHRSWSVGTGAKTYASRAVDINNDRLNIENRFETVLPEWDSGGGGGSTSGGSSGSGSSGGSSSSGSSSTSTYSYAYVDILKNQGGQYFFENGEAKTEITLSREMLELTGFGTKDTFYGWVVTNRIDLLTEQVYGRSFKALVYGRIVITGTGNAWDIDLNKSFISSYDGSSFDFQRIEAGKYQIGFDNAKWAFNDSKHVVFATGYGPVEWNPNAAVITTGPCKATYMPLRTYYKNNNINDGLISFYNGIEIWVSDDETVNDGSFCFMICHVADFPMATLKKG